MTPDTLASFSSALRGRIVQAGDADYETSRQVYNAMIDRYPKFIVQVRDVADVIIEVSQVDPERILAAAA